MFCVWGRAFSLDSSARAGKVARERGPKTSTAPPHDDDDDGVARRRSSGSFRKLPGRFPEVTKTTTTAMALHGTAVPEAPGSLPEAIPEAIIKATPLTMVFQHRSYI